MKTTTKEYLEQYREDVPEWLKAYQRGKSRSLADFLKSRIVYYPGSGIDGDPVEVFGASHSAHCFVYADYWLPKDELTKELHTHGFRGYDILDEVSFSEREVMDAIPWRRHFLSEEEMRAAANGTAEMRQVMQELNGRSQLAQEDVACSSMWTWAVSRPGFRRMTFPRCPQRNSLSWMAVDRDAVIGYDFFKSFTVLLNRREMRLSFKPAGK